MYRTNLIHHHCVSIGLIPNQGTIESVTFGHLLGDTIKMEAPVHSCSGASLIRITLVESRDIKQVLRI